MNIETELAKIDGQTPREKAEAMLRPQGLWKEDAEIPALTMDAFAGKANRFYGTNLTPIHGELAIDFLNRCQEQSKRTRSGGTRGGE